MCTYILKSSPSLVTRVFLLTEEVKVRGQRRLSYDDEVLFSYLVEDHLADVFVEGWRQRNLGPLVISTHQQVGFICRGNSGQGSVPFTRATSD